MKMENRICQNCKQGFVIEPDDFAFYEKIKVPPPTWCPECRLQRRLIWRNERTLYKRRCSAPGHGEDVVSMYHPESGVEIYDHDFWYEDGWDPTAYGKDYNFTRPFFEQFRELLCAVPHLALFDSKSVNSSYCNVTVEHKNCYLVSAGWNNEDSLYSNRISYCKDTVDSYNCHKTEFSYGNVQCKDSYQLFFSLRSQNCNNSYFLYDCRNCSDCIGCVNLRNKQYYIFNQPHSKEEYTKKVQEMNLGSIRTLRVVEEKFNELYKKSLHKYAQLTNTVNVVGDNVEDSKNCHYCFDLAGGAESSKYANWGTYGLKDSYDTGPGTGGKSELTYEGISIGVNNANCKFGVVVWYSHDVQYSFGCFDSQNLFGCVGLRNKQYCILNKQYSKDEYESLLPKIVEQMKKIPYADKKGRVYAYGDFFPAEISPFAYNESVSQDYMPISREEAERNGFPWRNAEEKEYKATVSAESLPDTIEGISDSILRETIACAHGGKCNDQCTTAFRIVPQELQFYRRLNLPLPRLCPNCRHYERLRKRNPLKLWHRQCMCDYSVYKNTVKHNHHPEGRCPNEFETSYAPDRPEIVYCEQCYNAEVV